MKGAKPNLGNVIPMSGDAPRVVPDPPELMSPDGQAVWSRLAPLLVRKDRLEPEYEDMFAAYCEAAGDVIALTSNIAVMGRTYSVKTRNGNQQKKTADWQARIDALQVMRQFSALFGLTPVDAQRVSSSGQGDLLAMLEAQLNGSD